MRPDIPGEALIPVISMWQPYASLLFAWDRDRGEFAKAYETRGFPLPPRLIGQPVAIHATAKFAPERVLTEPLTDLCYDMFGCGYNFSLPRGAIIGVVEFGRPYLTASLRADQPPSEIVAGDWSDGRWAWPVISADRLVQPIPAKGRQGWWRHSASAIEARRAETGTGSVHESAAPKADAQPTPTPHTEDQSNG